MDISTLVGIAGVILTLVFGFLSFDLFKRKKYPGRVTYVKLSIIDLLNNVANNFKEIKLLHNDSPIKKNIIYIKGALLNNGDIDINSQLTEKDISVHLPENCKWLDIKVTEFSDGLTANIETEHNEIAVFKFDLFRKSEYLQFEGLVEASNDEISSETIESQMYFKHRIESTSKIETKNLLSEREIKRKKRSAFLSSIFMLVILILASSVFFNVFKTNGEKVYFSKITEKADELYKIELAEKMIVLNPVVNDNKELVVSLNEFNNNYIATSRELTFIEKFKTGYWFLTVYFGLILIIILADVLEINKARRLSKILTK